MRELVDLFGEDKILFATDYPFDGVTESIQQCKEAIKDDPAVLDKVFYRNSAKLLPL